MPWTYSGDPATSPADLIRFLLGDTDATMGMLSDAEVSYALSIETNHYMAAAFLAERLGARYASDESFSVDGVSLGGGRSRGFFSLAASLREQAGRNPTPLNVSAYNGILILTGVRVGQMRSADWLADRPRPAFNRINESQPRVYRDPFEAEF